MCMALLKEQLIKCHKGNVPRSNRVFYFLHSFSSMYLSLSSCQQSSNFYCVSQYITPAAFSILDHLVLAVFYAGPIGHSVGKDPGMSFCNAFSAPCTRSVGGLWGTSCQNNEDWSLPTVQGLGYASGWKVSGCQHCRLTKGVYLWAKGWCQSRREGILIVRDSLTILQSNSGKLGWTSQLW